MTSQKSVFSSKENYAKLLGLTLYTSVICKVECILYVVFLLLKTIYKVNKRIKCTYHYFTALWWGFKSWQGYILTEEQGSIL